MGAIVISQVSGGSDANAFAIVQPPNGTSPTADSVSDTLTFTSSDGSVTITGDATTDTIDFKAVAPGAGSNVSYTTSVKTTSYSLGTSETAILVNSTGATTMTLPTASGVTNRIYIIKNINTGTTTVLPSGADTIDGGASAVISTRYSSVNLISANSNWYIF